LEGNEGMNEEEKFMEVGIEIKKERKKEKNDIRFFDHHILYVFLRFSFFSINGVIHHFYTRIQIRSSSSTTSST
jgi:hypothetical protein